MDTNSTKMAPSQTLADYKATGFSTHSADAIWSVGTRALTDKAGFSLSTVGIKAIWDQLTSALTTVGSAGKLIVDNINATITSRAPANEYDTDIGEIKGATFVTGTDSLESIRNRVDGLNDLSAAEVNTECDTALADYGANTVVPDAAGVAPTAIEIRNEINANLDRTGFSLSGSAIDDILDEEVEGTHTMRELLRIMASTLCGKSTGGGTATISFRDLDDTKDRVVATVTTEGNRSNVILTEN